MVVEVVAAAAAVVVLAAAAAAAAAVVVVVVVVVVVLSCTEMFMQRDYNRCAKHGRHGRPILRSENTTAWAT